MSTEERPKFAKKKKKPESTADDASKKKKPPKASDEEQASEQENTNTDTNVTDAPKPASKKKKKKKKPKNGEGGGSSTPQKKKKAKPVDAAPEATPVDQVPEATPVDQVPESTTFVPFFILNDIESGVSDRNIDTGNTAVDGVIAVEVANTTPNEERKSPLFLGSCCDLVVATIVVDSIYLAFNFLYAIVIVIGLFLDVDPWLYMFFLSPFIPYWDILPPDWYEDNTVLYVLMFKWSISIVFCVIGIIGAVRSNLCLVRTAAVLLSIEVIPNFMFFHWQLALIALVLVPFPHICLSIKLSNMPPET